MQLFSKPRPGFYGFLGFIGVSVFIVGLGWLVGASGVDVCCEDKTVHNPTPALLRSANNAR
jgi:hypothetical protein